MRNLTPDRLAELAPAMIPHLIAAHGVLGPCEDGSFDSLRIGDITEHTAMHRTWLGVAWRPQTSEQMIFQHPVTWTGQFSPSPLARWAMRRETSVSTVLGTCRFCGRVQSHDCRPAACAVCGSRQCEGGDTCRVCYYGFMPAWRPGARAICGYKGCGKPAVAKVPRVHRACLDCCVARVKITVHAEQNRRVPLTQYVEDRLVHRDSGKGWEHWRWVA
jgi:hypothetical protein